MSSAVDICNLALAFLGDTATIASIDPPEGSAQSEHAARFYPIARDSLLESYSWSFATKRASLAMLENTTSTWAFCYAVPADAINLMVILAPDAADDFSVQLRGKYFSDVGGEYTTQPFINEVNEDGKQVIYTNQEDAVLVYTARIKDTTKFSPLFSDALARLLASYMAGPIIKGEIGAAMSQKMYQSHLAVVSKAMVSDSNQRKVHPAINVAWMVGR